MDSSWINLPNDHPLYRKGCENFIAFAKEETDNGKIRCPCKSCKNEKWRLLSEVEGHIMFKGFYTSYKNWIFHGKGDIMEHISGSDLANSHEEPSESPSERLGYDDMEGLLRSSFGVDIPESSSMSVDEPSWPDNGEGEYESSDEHTTTPGLDEPTIPNIDAKELAKYKRLVAASNEKLYDGCTRFSKLSFLLHLFNLKSMNHWSIESFNMLLKLLGDAFPQIMEFPSSYYEAKKVMKDLGLEYEKIHVCPNNCDLYWGEHVDDEECHVCHTSRWTSVKGKERDTSDQNKASCKKGVPAKVMRYFPLIPRLLRSFMTAETAENMIWHDKGRIKDGKLRHPADGLAWKAFNARYPDFAADPRNLMLGVAGEGCNLYHLMNTTRSTWPVVLIPYNLPPWLCMKPSSFILSMIISGNPGNKIDVYLKPLIHELKLLWEGVDAFDAYTSSHFKLRAAVHSTINDYPSLSDFSGWPTKGYKACHVCTTSTPSFRFGGKICNFGHRKWLPSNHPYRFQCAEFDGKVELDNAPIPPTGSEILRQQESIVYVNGIAKKSSKKKRARNDGDQDDHEIPNLWNKRSIFFICLIGSITF